MEDDCFYEVLFSSPPSMSEIQPSPSSLATSTSSYGSLFRQAFHNQPISWSLECNFGSESFQTILCVPFFLPGISSLRPARAPHPSLARLPRATQWRRERFTPHRRVLCPGTACPGGRSSSRSRLSTAPGSAPP